MSYDSSLIELIESAHDAYQYCRGCGEHTTIRSDATAVYVECPRRAEPPTSLLGRIASAVTGHDRVLVYDLAA